MTSAKKASAKKASAKKEGSDATARLAVLDAGSSTAHVTVARIIELLTSCTRP